MNVTDITAGAAARAKHRIHPAVLALPPAPVAQFLGAHTIEMYRARMFAKLGVMNLS